MKQIIYLGYQPTPYTQYMLESLRHSHKFQIKIFFSHIELSEMPWKTKIIGRRDGIFKKFIGIDWSIVNQAFKDKSSLFFVVGWFEPTQILVMIIRGMLKHPFCLFTDSVKTEKTFFFRLKQIIFPILFSRVNAILTTGEFGIRRFRESKFCRSTIKVINFPFFVPLPNLEAKSDVSATVTFLCSGRLVERKGFDLVIEAFSNCKRAYSARFKLLIAGTGDQMKALNDLTHEYNLQTEVKFLGWLEPFELQKALIDSNVFIHFVPILDPFPVAVLEAMAAGMPIIGSNKAGSVMERVKHGENGFIIDPKEANGLTNAIMKFIENPSLVKQMGAVSRAIAEEWPVERAESILETIF